MDTESRELKSRLASWTPPPAYEDHSSRLLWRIINTLGVIAPVVFGAGLIFGLLRYYETTSSPFGPLPSAPAAARVAGAPDASAAGPALRQPAPPAAATNPVESAQSPSPNAPPTSPQPVNLSPELAESMRVAGDPPLYPAIAKAAHLEGTVVLQATVAADGTVQALTARSGPPILQNAAVTAVRAWRYKPFELDGKPVSFRTQITLRFRITPPAAQPQ